MDTDDGTPLIQVPEVLALELRTGASVEYEFLSDLLLALRHLVERLFQVIADSVEYHVLVTLFPVLLQVVHSVHVAHLFVTELYHPFVLCCLSLTVTDLNKSKWLKFLRRLTYSKPFLLP